MELAMIAEIQAVLFKYMHCMDPNGPSVLVFRLELLHFPAVSVNSC